MLAQGCSVVLLGDLNIAPYMLDHCDWCNKASQPMAHSQFLHHRPDRKWFQDILAPDEGLLTDVFRKFHPDRCDMSALIVVLQKPHHKHHPHEQVASTCIGIHC